MDAHETDPTGGRRLAGRGGGRLYHDTQAPKDLQRLFGCIDGRRSAAELLTLLSWDEEQLRVNLEKLLEKGYIRALEPHEKQAATHSTPLEVWSWVLSQLEAYSDSEHGIGSFRKGWPAATKALSDTYPCLNPWLPDLTFESGQVKLYDQPAANNTHLEALVAVTLHITRHYSYSSDLLKKLVLGGDSSDDESLVSSASGRGGYRIRQSKTHSFPFVSAPYGLKSLEGARVTQLWHG